MSKHSKIGIKGEQIAKDFLEKKGYTILFTNWRAGKKEVDIVALQKDLVIFVEVKTRASTFFGFPEEAVNTAKQNNFRAAASSFLDAYTKYRDIRFDIISIILKGDDVLEIIHFEEAFC